jgi:hypothetical protein
VSRLDADGRIIRLARDLGLRGLGGPVAQVIDYCNRRIATLAGGREITSLAQLQDVVARMLNLEFEEIHRVADIERIVQKYAVCLKDPAFASIRTQFNEDTFGTMFRRRTSLPTEPPRYVAVIDCRGPKANRRFFTRWHEIAHLLTLPPREGAPVKRCSIKRNPTEQLMDRIAASVGFYDPLFKPIVEQLVQERGGLTFEGVESVRLAHCPMASFQSTLIACVTRAPCPALYLEARLGYKKRELERLDERQLRLFAMDEPEARIRIAQVSASDPARKLRLRIDRNLEVPAESILARLLSEPDDAPGTRNAAGVESLTLWRHSDGKALGSTNIRIEARRLNDSVFALVCPA